MKKCKFEFDHYPEEDDCIICNHDDSGGNWKRWAICLFLRHEWDYVYSWYGRCLRCWRERTRKDY